MEPQFNKEFLDKVALSMYNSVACGKYQSKEDMVKPLLGIYQQLCKGIPANEDLFYHFCSVTSMDLMNELLKTGDARTNRYKRLCMLCDVYTKVSIYVNDNRTK